MTFNNLKFRPHSATIKGIAATLELNKNTYLSVVAGPGFYSSPGGLGGNYDIKDFDDYPDSNDFASFETAIIEDDNVMDVVGWQSRENINEIIKKYK